MVTFEIRETIKHFNGEGACCGAINDFDGAAARVALNKKMAKVYCDREIDARVIEEVICKRGYEAVLIE